MRLKKNQYRIYCYGVSLASTAGVRFHASPHGGSGSTEAREDAGRVKLKFTFSSSSVGNNGAFYVLKF